MNCKHGMYIDVKSDSGQLLRSGNIYQPTIDRMNQTSKTTLWLLGVESANQISYKDVYFKNFKQSQTFTMPLIHGGSVEVYYRKVTP